MRGRKTDSEFLINFINDCIKENKNSSEDITNKAKSKVLDIDNKIKEVESLRLVRGNLLDVIAAFEKPVKQNEVKDIRNLSFLNLKKMNICKFICQNIMNDNLDFKNELYSEYDLMFCIKQLISYNILCKTNNNIMRGEMFDEYVKFLSFIKI